MLFLNPNSRGKGDPPGVIGTVSVNYSCGHSKPWREVSESELQDLQFLSNR